MFDNRLRNENDVREEGENFTERGKLVRHLGVYVNVITWIDSVMRDSFFFLYKNYYRWLQWSFNSRLSSVLPTRL